MGERHVYWTDWDQKILWSLPKEGSVDGPVPLRRYRQKPMAVIVLQYQPIVCQPIPSIDTQNSAAAAEKIDSPANQIIGIHDDVAAGMNTSLLNNTPQEIQNTADPVDAALCNGYCFNEGHCFFINDEISCR